ncbi:helix-turn-helix domain-containing protein [Lacimicrobium alkaliphilum]|uniref:Transcriptional regulator n=1 Tax=Lacimicrobium alkaliphilum TaxID=1526571 RepID=A0ABQ1RHQ9_9ALTE|nr:helix-turn-helix domain-containing protein [Lacimicrobium alkaliphilum]GGD70197.1 transcriptional regulator [Lacimicrobium alkaliphilum]
MNITRPEQLSTYIKEQRKKAGMTQKQVSDRVGIRIATISDFENKPESCKLETFFKILAALDLQLDVTPRGKRSQSLPHNEPGQWNEGW